jgi:D-alanine--poly(phosphoribitol) ligase subunit 1
MDLYLSLVSGSTLFSIDKKMISDLKELFDNLKGSDISIWVSTPSFAEMCLSDKNFKRELLPKLTTMLFCGETLANECVRKLHERFDGIRVVNSYGPTEATVAVTALDIDAKVCEVINPLPVGYVKKDCSIIISDSKGKEVLPGERGEIIIAGDSVSPGYYKNTQMTEKAFFKIKTEAGEKRCYRTGDEGYLQDGLLYYCGRIDFQVKLNGYRIELEDIESNLRKLENVKNAVVIPIVENSKVKYLVGVVVMATTVQNRSLKHELELKSRLRGMVPEYMVPRRIIFRDSLPMNTNGKVDRKRLLEELT